MSISNQQMALLSATWAERSKIREQQVRTFFRRNTAKVGSTITRERVRALTASVLASADKRSLSMAAGEHHREVRPDSNMTIAYTAATLWACSQITRLMALGPVKYHRRIGKLCVMAACGQIDVPAGDNAPYSAIEERAKQKAEIEEATRA